MEILDTNILEKICSAYGLARETAVAEEVSEGYLSHNFILHNGRGRLFLKQYRFGERSKVEEIHRVKSFFHQGGIPIILPLADRADRTILEAKGRFYALFPFVEGRIIRRRERTLEALASAGRMLGRIHALSREGRLPLIQNKANGWGKEGFLRRAAEIERLIRARSHPTPYDELALRTLDSKVRLAAANTVRYEDFSFQNDHLIHGDYYGSNIFYGKDGEVSHVFDLENAKLSPRVLEVARTLDYMCFSGEYEAENFRAARAFLSAYDDIYFLEKDELARGIRARYLERVHSLWMEEEHYLKDNSRMDCFLEGELRMFDHYSKACDELIAKVLDRS